VMKDAARPSLSSSSHDGGTCVGRVLGVCFSHVDPADVAGVECMMIDMFLWKMKGSDGHPRTRGPTVNEKIGITLLGRA
jgi:hypothetical protein